MDLGAEIDDGLLSPPPLYHAAQNIPAITQDAYSQYQNGAMIFIGDLRNSYYHCGFEACGLLFPGIDELQNHFEGNHFPYSRIQPPFRFRCTSCRFVGNDMTDSQCRRCRDPSQFEFCIYGQFISPISRGRYSSDEQDLLQYTPTTTSQYALSHGSPSINLHEDPIVASALGSFQQDHYDRNFGFSFDHSFGTSDYQPQHNPALNFGYVNNQSSSFLEEDFSQERNSPAGPLPRWSSTQDFDDYGASPGTYDNLNAHGANS